MLAPTNKIEFYRRWREGEFGNRIRSFDSYADLCKSGYQGLTVVRYKVPGHPFCRYEIPRHQVEEVLEEFVSKGARRDLFTFNESAPDSRLILQGEVCRSIRHLELHYSRAQLPMRKALREDPQCACGLQALTLLRGALWPKSLTMLQELLEYDAVVEFSAFDRAVGDIPGHNTLIWEVRNY